MRGYATSGQQNGMEDPGEIHRLDHPLDEPGSGWTGSRPEPPGRWTALQWLGASMLIVLGIDALVLEMTWFFFSWPTTWKGWVLLLTVGPLAWHLIDLQSNFLQRRLRPFWNEPSHRWLRLTLILTLLGIPLLAGLALAYLTASGWPWTH